MISFTSLKISAVITAVSLLSACGGGSGGNNTSGASGFTPNDNNTKPQVSSEANSANSSIHSLSSQSISIIQSSSSKSSKAAVIIDVAAPILPSEPQVAFIDHDIVMLSWPAASDNVGVTLYKIYRNQVQIDQIDSREPFYDDYSVAPSSNYIYSISAGDAAGNWSPLKSISAKTPEAPRRILSSSSSDISNISSSSNSSTANTSSSSSSASSSPVLTNVHLKWNRPIYRENGLDLFEYEIARYELSYTLPNNLESKIYTIESPLTSITLPEISSNALLEIRAIDTNNRYSRYIQISPR